MNEANKETTADKAQVALNQLSCGEKTVNQVREEYGLDQIETAGTCTVSGEEMKHVCTKCNTVNKASANFCKGCGNKLNEICKCWIKKEPYNCGKEKCPGYQLFKLEKEGETK